MACWYGTINGYYYGYYYGYYMVLIWLDLLLLTHGYYTAIEIYHMLHDKT